jgi:hypothetical protein
VFFYRFEFKKCSANYLAFYNTVKKNTVFDILILIQKHSVPYSINLISPVKFEGILKKLSRLYIILLNSLYLPVKK